MSTNYPTGIDSYNNPSGTDRLNDVDVPHAQIHTNVNDAITAIETELGTTPSGSFSSVSYRLGSNLPIGSRMIALGDSITIGTGSSLAATASINGDSRQAPGCWFSRLCGQHPDRYYKIRNAGIGGDVIGGVAHTSSNVSVGATSVTVAVDYGNRPYNTAVPVYFGGYSSTNEARNPSSVTDNGNGTYAINFSTPLTGAYTSGTEVGYGMHGRLQANVIAWAPDTCLILAGTNDSGGTLTATEIVSGLMDFGTRLRAAQIEPVFLELLPRSTNMSMIAQVNDKLRYACQRGNSLGAYHLVPTYRAFASGTGTYANAGDNADGLHPSDVGHQKLADLVHTYLSAVPMRIAQVPRAAYDTDPTNLIQNACFLTASSGIPTGWTDNPFFSSGITPNVEAPASTDGIVGQWATLTAVSGSGNRSIQYTVPTQTTGDLVRIVCRVRTTGFTGGCQATVQFLTGSFTIDLGYLIADNMDATLMSTTTTLSAVTQSIFRFQIIPNGGSGKLWIAEPYMQNLTTLGRSA